MNDRNKVGGGDDNRYGLVGDYTRHLGMFMTNPLIDDTDVEQIKTIVRGVQFL